MESGRPRPLTFSLSGKLRHFRNQRRGRSRWAESAYDTRWKTNTRLAGGAAIQDNPAWKTIDPKAKKRITFRARVFNRFDLTGLAQALKPVQDAIVDLGLCDGDSPRHPHAWDFGERGQTIERRLGRQGVDVTVELAPDAEEQLPFFEHVRQRIDPALTKANA